MIFSSTTVKGIEKIRINELQLLQIRRFLCLVNEVSLFFLQKAIHTSKRSYTKIKINKKLSFQFCTIFFIENVLTSIAQTAPPIVRLIKCISIVVQFPHICHLYCSQWECRIIFSFENFSHTNQTFAHGLFLTKCKINKELCDGRTIVLKNSWKSHDCVAMCVPMPWEQTWIRSNDESNNWITRERNQKTLAIVYEETQMKILYSNNKISVVITLNEESSIIWKKI